MTPATEHEDPEPSLGLSVWGQSFKARGLAGVVIGVLVLVLGFVSYLLYDVSQRSASEELKQISLEHMQARERLVEKQTAEHLAIMQAVQTIQSEHLKIGEVVGEVNASIQEQNYIILSDPDEKERMKKRLRMPPSLKDKLK